MRWERRPRRRRAGLPAPRRGASAGARWLALERSNRYACRRGYRLRVSVAAGEASPPDCRSASAGLPGNIRIVRGRAPDTPAAERRAGSGQRQASGDPERYGWRARRKVGGTVPLPPEPTRSLAPPRPPSGKGFASGLRKNRPQATLASGRSEAPLKVSAPGGMSDPRSHQGECAGPAGGSGPGRQRSRWSRRRPAWPGGALGGAAQLGWRRQPPAAPA